MKTPCGAKGSPLKFFAALCTAAMLSACSARNGFLNGETSSRMSMSPKQSAFPNRQPSVETETVTGNVSAPDVEENVLKLSSSAEYFLSGKDEKLRSACIDIYQGIMNYQSEIDIPDGVISSDDFNDYLTMVVCTSPEISQFSNAYTISYDTDGFVTSMEAVYTKTQQDGEAELEMLDSRVRSICAMAEGLDDFAKVKLFHDEIIKNCEYTDTADSPYSAYGCLIDGKAVCEGYSKAMLMLCENADIECLPVMGVYTSEDNTETPHMWNMVKLDGKWYNIDVTWDDPICDFGSDYVRYDYMNVTDEEFFTDHTPDSSVCMSFPKAESMTDNYFVKTGKYVESIDMTQDILLEAVIESTNNGERYARIKCADDETFSSAVEMLFTDGKIFDVLSSAAQETGGQSASSYSYMTNADVRTITIII